MRLQFRTRTHLICLNAYAFDDNGMNAAIEKFIVRTMTLIRVSTRKHSIENTLRYRNADLILLFFNHVM